MNESTTTAAASAEDEARFIRAQSIELRKGLEELMEHIQNSRHEESSESLEERYLLLLSTYPPECLKIAVTLTDADVMEYESSMIYSSSPSRASSERETASLRLPIHLAFDKNAPLSIVKSLLEADKRKNGDHPSVTRADKWGDLPIHIACSRASAAISESDQQLYGMGLLPSNDQYIDIRTRHYVQTVESIRLLLNADRDRITLSIKDVYESLPLHTAARYNAPPKVISMLLEKSRSGLYTEGLHGQFPLTVACRSGDPRPEVLRLLLEHDDAHALANPGGTQGQPSTVLHKETTGRLPIHVFMLRNKCEQCLRILLEHMFGTSCNKNGLSSRNSILSTGLDGWKRLWLTEVIPAMDGKTLYERDFTTRDKLDVICEEAKVVCEACLSLELVTWKMSILVGIREEAADTTTSTLFLQDEGWKQKRRIVSGAEVIVPNVLSFLEDEPVARILDRFRTYGYIGKHHEKKKTFSGM